MCKKGTENERKLEYKWSLVKHSFDLVDLVWVDIAHLVCWLCPEGRDLAPMQDLVHNFGLNGELICM